MLDTVSFNGQSKQNSYSIAVVSYVVSLTDKFSLWAVDLPVFCSWVIKRMFLLTFSTC